MFWPMNSWLLLALQFGHVQRQFLLSGIAALQDEKAELIGKERKNQRAAKGREIQALKREQRHDCTCSCRCGACSF
jgi:hypothetical protein